MKVIITICSRRKDENPELLPAHKRYLAEHIQKTREIAKRSNLEFYILSGKHGLLHENELVENYDYYLEAEKVESLASNVATQLNERGITEMDFYTEGKESWIPYENVLKQAANQAGVVLKINQL